MNESKLVHFLRLLTTSERKRFREFLDSPYFNRRQDCKDLYGFLEKHFLKKEAQLGEEKLHTLVYGKGDFNKLKFKKLKVALMDLLTTFIAQVGYEKALAAERRFFLRELNARGEDKHFVRYYNDAKKFLSQSNSPVADIYYEGMLLEEEMDNFLYKKPERTTTPHLKEAMEGLGNSFLIRMMKFMIRAVSHADITGTRQDLPWISQALDFIKANEEKQIAIVRVLHTQFLMFSYPEDDEMFRNARQLLREKAGELSKEDAYNSYTIALNHAAKRLNSGRADYLAVMFALFREMLDNGTILIDGKISVGHFKNIVSIACRLAEFEWASSFMETYKNRIANDYKENAINFNRGVIAFFKEEFGAAERCFNHVLNDFKDIFYGLDARILLLRIHYETGNAIGMESLCHSFRMYLDRTKAISKPRKENYKTFIAMYRRMINLPPRDYERMEKLKTEILETGNKVGWRAWLVEKIEDLLAAKVSS